jgi:hypothetical protein
MSDLATLVRDFPVQAVYPLIDKMRLWTQEPLRINEINSLKRVCGNGAEVENEEAYFDWRYKQKLELHQPFARALDMPQINKNHVLLNYLEISFEFVFEQPAVEAWLEFFMGHFLQPWHRKSDHVGSYENGGLTTRIAPDRGERRTGHWTQMYSDRDSKVVGSSKCFRIEGKYEGVQFVRRIGILRPKDVLGFDFGSYFKKWMRLYELDLERLGRTHHNKLASSKRKKSNVQTFGALRYNHDLSRGAVLYRALSRHKDGSGASLQQFADTYGRGRFLKPLPFDVQFTGRPISSDFPFPVGVVQGPQ